MRLTDDFSFEEQKEIGIQMRDAILEDDTHFKILNPSLNDCAYGYLHKIESMLVERDMLFNARLFDWEIYLIDDLTKSSAFTLPGGYVFITTGLMDFVESESQLLSIITHEMAYADRGHMMDRLVAEYGMEVFEGILNNEALIPIESITRKTPQLVFDAEVVKEADLFSASMICPFTYVADGIGEIITKHSPYDALDWLETKPSYPDRKAFLESYTSKTCCHGEASFTERFEGYKEECFGMGG